MANKKSEEIKEEVVEEVKEEFLEENNLEPVVEATKEVVEEYTGDLRGFKTLEEAINYPNTKEFEKLDIGCKTEYSNWLKSILKED